MLRSKIQFIVKRSFDGCCEAKSSIQYSGALMDVAKQNPEYCKAELWWMHEVNPVSKRGALVDFAKQNPLSFHKIKSSDFTQSIFVLRRY
jgi:hypothetical protein